jgi:hypothetical protein
MDALLLVATFLILLLLFDLVALVAGADSRDFERPYWPHRPTTWW